MRLIFCLITLPLFIACASRQIELTPPDFAGSVPVEDMRITKDVTMHFKGGNEAWLLPVNPSLAASLRGWLAQEKPAGLEKVEIEQLVLVNDVGFGTVDDQDCIIESAVRRRDGTTIKVRTAVKDKTNMASAAARAGAVILTACLREHAQDIARTSK